MSLLLYHRCITLHYFIFLMYLLSCTQFYLLFLGIVDLIQILYYQNCQEIWWKYYFRTFYMQVEASSQYSLLVQFSTLLSRPMIPTECKQTILTLPFVPFRLKSLYKFNLQWLKGMVRGSHFRVLLSSIFQANIRTSSYPICHYLLVKTGLCNVQFMNMYWMLSTLNICIICILCLDFVLEVSCCFICYIFCFFISFLGFDLRIKLGQARCHDDLNFWIVTNRYLSTRFNSLKSVRTTCPVES